MAGEPYDYASGGLQALQGGLQMGLGMRQAQAVEREQAKADAAQQRQQQFLTDFQTAAKGGDNKALLDVMVAYPEQADTIQKTIGIQDTQHAKELGSFASNLSAMIDSGDINGAMGLVAQNEEVLRRQGRDPAQFIQSLRDNPAAVKQGAEAMMYATLPYDKQVEFKNKLEDQAIARDRIAATREGHAVTAAGQRAVASRAAGGGTAGGKLAGNGLQWAQLADGTKVQVNTTKPWGAGSNQFYPGRDANGNFVRVPVSAIVAPETAGQSAMRELGSADMALIKGASDEELGSFTGLTGGIGKPSAFAEEVTTKLAGGRARELLAAADRINRGMQMKGIASAKDMGASGINSIHEAQMYFAQMPQLDYSSPQALRQSMIAIENATAKWNSEHPDIATEQESPPQEQQATGKAPQAAIDYLSQNPQFKAAFKAKYGYLPEGM